MIHAYPRARRLAAIASDVVLIGVVLAIAAARPDGPLVRVLAVAIPCVLAWGILTLHHPREVEVDDDGVAFRAYGRERRYAWRDVRAIHVRRFLVGDRVLVRVVGAGSTGRYWLHDSMEGYAALVARLEAFTGEASATRSTSSPRSGTARRRS